MKCIKPGKNCGFRRDNGMYTFDCPLNSPGSECDYAAEWWGCPFACIFEALEDGGCILAQACKERLEEVMECARKPFWEDRIRCLDGILYGE